MHQTVLAQETLALLDVRSGGCFVDATVGSGGHAAAILKRSAPDGRLLAIDRDPAAVGRAQTRLAAFGDRARVVRGTHEALATIATGAGFNEVDGVLFDLGVSSDQLDTPERGFSFRADGPLDMRMDPDGPLDAAALLRSLSDWRELAGLLRQYGEEPRAAQIARAIWAEQQREAIQTTGRLATIVARAAGGTAGRARHPATRTFQALRIAVNGEIDGLETALEQALTLCREGGRVAVISFHSLEDRVVKHCFREHAGRWESLQSGGRRRIGRTPRVRIETRRPVKPSAQEAALNPRARSACLRVAQRIADETIDGARIDLTGAATEHMFERGGSS